MYIVLLLQQLIVSMGANFFAPQCAQQVVVALALLWIDWCCSGVALWSLLGPDSLCCAQQPPVAVKVIKV
jgi:hypothetical protein